MISARFQGLRCFQPSLLSVVFFWWWTYLPVLAVLAWCCPASVPSSVCQIFGVPSFLHHSSAWLLISSVLSFFLSFFGLVIVPYTELVNLASFMVHWMLAAKTVTSGDLPVASLYYINYLTTAMLSCPFPPGGHFCAFRDLVILSSSSFLPLMPSSVMSVRPVRVSVSISLMSVGLLRSLRCFKCLYSWSLGALTSSPISCDLCPVFQYLSYASMSPLW